MIHHIYDYTTLYEKLKPVIDLLYMTFTTMGLIDSCSMILAITLAIREEFTVNDYVALTGYAKSTISTCLGMLERMGFIHKVKRGRRYSYMPTSDIGKIFINRFRNILERKLKPLEDKLLMLLKDEKDEYVRSKLESLTSEVNNLIKVLEDLLSKV